MKRTGVVLFLLVAGGLLAQTWQMGPTTTFRLWRFDGEYFPGIGKVYFLGGRLSDGNTDGTVWSFDPVTGTYAATGATMPVPVSNYEVALLADSFDLVRGDTFGLYIVGGRLQNGTFTSTVQVYYPVSNRVRTIPTDTYPCRTGSTPYIPNNGIVKDNKLYTIGGFQSSVAPYLTNQVWCFDPLAPAGSRWVQLPNITIARGYISGAIVDSMLYAIGGDTFDGTSLYARKWCERLNLNDPGSGWSRIADLPSPNGDTRAIGFDSDSPYGLPGQIIVAGHGTWPSESVHCYRYDVATNSWSSFASLNRARRNHAAAFIPGDVNANGVPGIWVWGGRFGSDTAVLTSSEYYQLTATGLQTAASPELHTSGITACPNPFRNHVAFQLNSRIAAAEKTLRIADAAGRLVRVLPIVPEQRTVTWDGCDYSGRPVPEGVYFCQLPGCTATVRIVRSE